MKRRPRNSEQVDRTDQDQLRASLGAIRLSESELEEFAESLGRRHGSVLRRRVGVDVEQILAPEIGFRLGPRVPWYDLAHPVTPAGDHQPCRPSHSIAYAAGDFFLQDAGSLLALAACDADQDVSGGKLICDLCAAPGGKASALVEAVGPSGFVLANEPVHGRLAALAFNLTRTGSDRWGVSSSDPETLADRLGGVFDSVLVDAPCSGQALLSRGKQSASALSEKQIRHSAARQRRILDAATRLLRPGGKLVYSTCTFAAEENETQVDRLIEQNGLRPSAVDRLSPYASDIAPASYRLWPHRDACAGGFAACLESPSGSPSRVDEGFQRKTRSRPLRLPFEVSPWLVGIEETDVAAEFRIVLGDATAIAWPVDAPTWVESVCVLGPELAHRTGRTWKPAHALARRHGRGVRIRQTFEVDDATAKAFLSGRAVACPLIGYAVVVWKGRPLGWIKGSRTMGKNHLPASARLSGL